MRTALIAVAVLCLTTESATGQSATGRVWDINHHGWFMYFGDHPVRGKWGAHLEGQWRRHDVITRWQQLLLRPGVNYQFSENTMFTLGYAYVKTHPYGDYPANFPFPEHRIYQQVLVKQKAAGVRLQHRFRLEQRFLGRMIPGDGGAAKLDSWRYQNRYRHFLKAEIPLGQNGARSNWYVAFYDEIFINFAPKHGAGVFDQNRAYAAVGHSLGKAGKAEFGYMNQILARRNSAIRESNHTLQIGFFTSLPFGK